jgi:hypothetical protein
MTDETWLIYCMRPGHSEYLRGLDDLLVTFGTEEEAERAARELEMSDSYDGKYITRKFGWASRPSLIVA